MNRKPNLWPPAGPTGSKAKGARPAARSPFEEPAIGMEAEFSVVLDGEPARPEQVFGDPRAFLMQESMHRIGTSYHLPGGGAVYFDTGVIEIVTPVIEIEPECAARAGRSLWESMQIVRQGLDAWEAREGHDVRLVGFSTHYNVSFDLPDEQHGPHRTVEKLALLLAHLLPAPVMLLATNRRSTGVGVRPRGERVEITVDFTPSASLMIATGALIVGITRAVMNWPSYELDMLARRRFPVVRGFTPMPHTSRKGWLARHDCYPRNPFTTDVDAPVWDVEPWYWAGREEDARPLSMRRIARRIAARFARPVRHIAGPFTYRLIRSVLTGRVPALLDLPDRPPEYEDVGRLCLWDDLFPEHVLSRSRYERVLIRAISGRRLAIGSARYTPVRLNGWSEVVFRREADRSLHTFTVDFLTRHLDAWELPS